MTFQKFFLEFDLSYLQLSYINLVKNLDFGKGLDLTPNEIRPKKGPKRAQENILRP